MRANRAPRRPQPTPVGDEPTCAPEAGATPGIPNCDTGPAGRLAWTVREILALVRRRG